MATMANGRVSPYLLSPFQLFSCTSGTVCLLSTLIGTAKALASMCSSLSHGCSPLQLNTTLIVCLLSTCSECEDRDFANTHASLPLHTMIKINNDCTPSIHFLVFHANSKGSCENEQMHMFI